MPAQTVIIDRFRACVLANAENEAFQSWLLLSLLPLVESTARELFNAGPSVPSENENALSNIPEDDGSSPPLSTHTSPGRSALKPSYLSPLAHRRTSERRAHSDSDVTPLRRASLQGSAGLNDLSDGMEALAAELSGNPAVLEPVECVVTDQRNFEYRKTPRMALLCQGKNEIFRTVITLGKTKITDMQTGRAFSIDKDNLKGCRLRLTNFTKRTATNELACYTAIEGQLERKKEEDSPNVISVPSSAGVRQKRPSPPKADTQKHANKKPRADYAGCKQCELWHRGLSQLIGAGAPPPGGQCSHTRHRFATVPATPASFWDVGFPPTQQRHS